MCLKKIHFEIIKSINKYISSLLETVGINFEKRYLETGFYSNKPVTWHLLYYIKQDYFDTMKNINHFHNDGVKQNLKTK